MGDLESGTEILGRSLGPAPSCPAVIPPPWALRLSTPEVTGMADGAWCE